MSFIVCKTKEDVEKARQEYLRKKRLRLKLIHCVFQARYQQPTQRNHHVSSKR